ncbi:MAG TPA: alpha/beta hydrolase, partial [bacterium]|nr:alpha/beta hydrolase [bacterium]
PFVDAGWRVLTADWPGNGRSGDYDAECTVELIVDCFEELVERTVGWERPIVICGHSAGGAIAQMIYLRAPERTSALILLQTSSRFMDGGLLPAVNVFMPAYKAVLKHPAVVGAASTALRTLRDAGASFLNEDNSVMIYLETGAMLPENKHFAEEAEAFANLNLDGLLGEISAPTLIVGSCLDQVIPLGRVKALHRGIAGSELRVISRPGHNAVLHFADEVNVLMRDFLLSRV